MSLKCTVKNDKVFQPKATAITNQSSLSQRCFLLEHAFFERRFDKNGFTSTPNIILLRHVTVDLCEFQVKMRA